MKLVFVGSGEFGLPTLQALHETRGVMGVVTQPDRPAGRKRKLTPTAIATWAQKCGLPILKTRNANDQESIDIIKGWAPDASVVVAFGQKLGPQLLAALGELTVNLHASLLPKYRGAASINAAIVQGETQTGLSVISLAERMDAGLVYGQVSTAIDPQETAGELHDRLAAMGPALIERVLAEHDAGTLEGQPQDESQVTYAKKMSKADGVVDFADDAETVRNRIHGLTPWPGVHVDWHSKDGTRQTLMLRRAAAAAVEHGASPGEIVDEQGGVACGSGVLRLLEVQTPGKRRVAIEEFLRGHDLKPGDYLATPSD